MSSLEVAHQYKTTDLLRIRTETHRRYTETPLDLDAECANLLALSGDEALADIGCGPGAFLRYLRGRGHRGRLAGVDQSAAMVAEAGRAAADGGVAVELFEGVADALPFEDGEFPVLSARHMLYHVPDVAAALREFARVVGPGGVVLAATNGRRNLPGLFDLEDAVAVHFGLDRAADLDMTGPFNAENAAGQLRAVFPEVEEKILPGALVFSEAAPIVDYVMTQSVPQQAADDAELFGRIRAWLTAETQRRLAASGGVWRDPKTVALYRCVN